MSDLIDRDEVIEAIENVDWYHQNRNKDMVSGANDDEHQAWYKADDIYKALESIPSARPKAEWIKNIDGDYECSECHVAIRGDDKPIYPFCAWCGADMRGERSGTDKDKFEQ